MMGVRIERESGMHGNSASAIATWLAEVFIAPLTHDVVAAYRSHEGTQVLEAIGDEVGCKPGIDRMLSVLAGNGSAASIECELATAYMLLFEGVAGLSTVPLYESAYSAEGNRLFQRATDDMAVLLQHCELSVSNECREPPDHLSIELALLSAMLRNNDQPRVALLLGRLRTWVPDFSARCGRADDAGFYNGAAMILNDFVAIPTLHHMRCAA